MLEMKSSVNRNLSLLRGILPYWRGVNIVVFIVAVFAPWALGFAEVGSVGNGEPFFYPGWFILILFFILQPPALPGLFLYFIFSSYRFIKSSSWLRYLLFILAGINFLSFAWMIWFFWGADVLWGYWLMCVGILSSLILEMIDFYRLKESK